MLNYKLVLDDEHVYITHPTEWSLRHSRIGTPPMVAKQS
jgi:hypothetical protein